MRELKGTSRASAISIYLAMPGVVLAGLDAGDDGLVGVHHEGEPLLGKVLGNAMRPDLLTKRVNAGLYLFLFVVHGAKGTLMTNQS